MAKKTLLIVVLAVIAINVVLVLLVLNDSGSGTRPPLPEPNGYNDLVAAGRLLRGPVSDYTKMSREELAGLVAGNQGALDLARTGLGRECRVPVVYSQTYFADSSPDLTALKPLAGAFAAAGRLAELDGRTNDAAKAYLDGMRLGQESFRGGLLINRLVGIACEAISAKPLGALMATLDAKTCHDIARALETMDAKEEPFEKTVQEEKTWMRKSTGIGGQIRSLMMRKQLDASYRAGEGKAQSIALQRRRMILDFAARAFELEKGKRPQTAAELVPEYLKAVPKDPTTGKELGLGF